MDNQIPDDVLKPEKVVEDPHHNNWFQWSYVDGILYHKPKSSKIWTVVNRVSFTPARFQEIVKLFNE